MSMFAVGVAKWPGLSKLTEEMGEVGQVIGKLMGSRGVVEHWDGTNLADRLESELGDLSAAIEFVIEKNNLDIATIEEQRLRKLAIFRKWHSEGTK